jgi:hypothetical protein
MKEIIKKIPGVKKLISILKQNNSQSSTVEFTTSKDYWENRYKNGGNSGAGSYNNLAEFKAEVLNDFIIKYNVKTVIELGSGDGNQLKYFNFPSYIGFDVSKYIIEKCNEKFKDDSTKKFFHIDEIKTHKAELTLSLDVIYHLVEDDAFNNYMVDLFNTSSKYVIIYANNDENDAYRAPHVKPRKFTNWIEQNQPNFKLIEHIPNKYPFQKEKGDSTSIADFYIFEKIS